MPLPPLPASLTLQPDLPPHSTVKIIGLGGVGGILARYGAVFLASLDRELRLALIDGDAFETRNLTRMVFQEIGNKAAVTRKELLPLVRDTRLSLVAIEDYVTAGNVAKLIHEGDHVLLAVDNNATRRLVSEHCAALDNVLLVSGGNDGVEEGGEGRPQQGTFGNVQVYLRHDGADVCPSLTRFHPEIAKPADRNPTDLDCTGLVASVPQILFANLTVAAAMLNSFLLHSCGALHYPELVFDIAKGRMQPVNFEG